VLSVPITQLELEVYVSQLPLGKQPGDDEIPNEFLRSAPAQEVADTLGTGQAPGPSLQNILLACVNEILCKGRMPHAWKGARTKLLLKKHPVTQLTNWRPVCLLRTAAKVATAIINDRLARLFEAYDILERQQEGNQRQHNTIRQVSRLLQVIEDARRTKSTLYVLYLDLVNAYNATNLRALFNIYIPSRNMGFQPKMLKCYGPSWLTRGYVCRTSLEKQPAAGWTEV
jgi:hypothetical protein